MDFFHGLDKGRYGAFKTDMLNSWAAGAFEPLTTVNQIYCTMGSWVKQAPKSGGRTASTYVMMEESAKQVAANKKKQQRSKQKQRSRANKKKVQNKRPHLRTGPTISAAVVVKRGI
jgi:hypothetical protein